VVTALRQQRLEGFTARRVQELFGVRRPTLNRWMRYFREIFPHSPTWQRLRGLVSSSVSDGNLLCSRSGLSQGARLGRAGAGALARLFEPKPPNPQSKGRATAGSSPQNMCVEGRGRVEYIEAPRGPGTVSRVEAARGPSEGAEEMDDQGVAQWERWGSFAIRSSEAAREPSEGGELSQALSELAQKRYRHPVDRSAGEVRVLDAREVVHRARNAPDPVRALGRRVRRDVVPAENSAPNCSPRSRRSTKRTPLDRQAHLRQPGGVRPDQARTRPLPVYQTVRKAMRARGWLRKRRPLREPTQVKCSPPSASPARGPKLRGFPLSRPLAWRFS